MPDVPWEHRKKRGVSMSKKKSSLAGLQALYARVCGLDVHKKLVVACVRILDSKDGTVQSTLRKFGTMTADLYRAARVAGRAEGDQRGDGVDGGVLAAGVQPARRPFPGVGGQRPAHQEGAGEKDDMKDAEWIAQLLQCGLLRPSFVPTASSASSGSDAPTDQAGAAAKCGRQPDSESLETANIKLGPVASDVLGVSGRKMIEALIAGKRMSRCWRIWPSASFAARFPSCSALWKES